MDEQPTETVPGVVKPMDRGVPAGFQIAIVTPSLNCSAYIDETITSVVTQRGDFSIRYHVQDGGSTDGTVGHLEHWARILANRDNPWMGCRKIDFSFSVEQDSGVYDALDKAFAKVSGQAYTWLGSDDRLMPACFKTITSVLAEHPDIDWLTGPVNLCRQDGVPCCIPSPNQLSALQSNVFPRLAIAAGAADGTLYPIIQQEGTFWTERLWEKVQKRMDSSLRLAGDFELWTRMAQHAELITVLSPLATFRRREGQLSSSMQEYMAEVHRIQQVIAEDTSRALPVLTSAHTRKGQIVFASWAQEHWQFGQASSLVEGIYQRWTPVEGVAPQEGPFPELGFPRPFHWLTGHYAQLRLWPQAERRCRLWLEFRNFHSGQRLLISGHKLKKSFALPVMNDPLQKFEVELTLALPASGYLLRFDYTCCTSPQEDPRELAIALLDLQLIPASSIPTRSENNVFKLKLKIKKLIAKCNPFKATYLGVLYQHPPMPMKPPRDCAASIANTELPVISIVTPTLNQGRYITGTIESVLSQEYPNLEYFIQDGLSSDETLAILRRHQSRLTGWESRPDSGQSQAINRGFSHATGEILGWLNSDDCLLPGALTYVGDYFRKHPDIDVVYGNRILIDENGLEVGRWILPDHDESVLSWADYIPQETLFWRRSIWSKVDAHIDESFSFAMDWDLIIRFRAAGAHFAHLPRFLGAFRVHPHQKTHHSLETRGRQEMDRIRENILGYLPSQQEIRLALRPFLKRHKIAHWRYRLQQKFGLTS